MHIKKSTEFAEMKTRFISKTWFIVSNGKQNVQLRGALRVAQKKKLYRYMYTCILYLADHVFLQARHYKKEDRYQVHESN